MAMKDGIKKVAITTLDVKDEICSLMIDAGVDPKEALKASTVVTMTKIDDIIEKVTGNQSASSITQALSNLGKSLDKKS